MQGKPRAHGHRAGSDALRRAVEAVAHRRIPMMTVYAFSSENWKRPALEVKQLLELFMRALTKEVRELDENGVKIRFIGDRSAFNPALRDGMRRSEKRTENNDRLILNVAVNYGGRADIVASARALAEAVRDRRLSADAIDEELMNQVMALGDAPSPDLLIRTGGERRLSNFLLWQCAYTELYFSNVLWPDFSAEHLDRALTDFAGRDRRFGGLSQVQNA
ncbi:MAG: polyprenyl diphosphate synthase [Pseudomonadota bacterium]